MTARTALPSLLLSLLLPACAADGGAVPSAAEEGAANVDGTPGVADAADDDADAQGPAAGAAEGDDDDEGEGGWTSLFDGTSAAAWRGFRQQDLPAGWQVRDGCLVRSGPGGDIVSREVYDDFELVLEWRIAPGGNSGIFFHVAEDADHVWQTGPEMQVLDNAGHPDGADPRTSAGANYALHAPVRDVTRPVGTFNEARIRVEGGRVTHWLNGVKLLEYVLLSPEWEARVGASKFASMPRYGREGSGHIALQDHGDEVAYRDIRIRRL